MEADCHDQKAHLVLKGLKAYIQMNNNPQNKPARGMFNRPLRPALHELRRPRIDLNFNDRLWKNENTSSSDTEKNEIFQNVENDYVNAEKEKQRILESCVCLRAVCLIHCKYCGYHCKGRVKKACVAHPTTMFLMDINQCPQCKTYDLKEYPLPEGY